MAYMIMDIETVPDLEAVERAEGDPDAYVQRLREKRQRDDVMIPWVYHRPVVLCGVYVPRSGEMKFISYRGRDSIAERWWKALRAPPYSTTVVTWNGRGFDIPVLEVEAMRHGIECGDWLTPTGTLKSWEDPRGRYSGYHWDLMDWATANGATWRMSQNAVASVLQIPGKVVGVEGSQVAGLYAEGRLDEIESYCAGDVLTLLCIFEKACRSCGLGDTADAVRDGLAGLVVQAVGAVEDPDGVHAWWAEWLNLNQESSPDGLDVPLGHGVI